MSKRKSVCRREEGGLVVRGADHLADPARVPSAVASTGNLVRGDTQTLIDALELQSEAALDVADHLGSELLGRALVGLMGEDHRCLMCARADIGHGLTDGSTIGIFGITIPSDDGVTTRVEVGGLLLVDATIGRAEKGGFAGRSKASDIWRRIGLNRCRRTCQGSSTRRSQYDRALVQVVHWRLW